MPIYELQKNGQTYEIDAPTPEAAVAALAPLGGESRPQSSVAPVEPPAPSRVRNITAMVAPTVGGIVGGLVGGAPGAAVGGAAGEGYRQILQHATELPSAVADVSRNLIDQPKATLAGFVEGAARGAANAAIEGGMQAVGEKAGQGVAWAGSKLARWLMNRATTRVTQKLALEFPELTETLIDHALTVSKGGYDKARRLLMTAKGEAIAALKVADASGKKIPVQLTPDLADSLKTAFLEQAIKANKVPVKPGTPVTLASKRLNPKLRSLFQQIDRAAGQRAGMHSKAVAGTRFDLTPSQADLLKTQLQRESRALYANRVAPNGPRALAMSATDMAEFASRLNDAIDSIAAGYKAANAEARPLIGAMRGIKQATRPSGNLYQAMVRPAVGAAVGGAAGEHKGGALGGVAGAVAGAAMTSPAGMSREAIILAHPAIRSMLTQLPKPVSQALAEFLTTTLPGLLGAPQQP